MICIVFGFQIRWKSLLENIVGETVFANNKSLNPTPDRD